MRTLILSLIVWTLSGSLEASEWIWKRSKILETDLARALALPKGELCFELGLFSCLDTVHLYTLGGNDAIGRSQYTALESPTQLSSLAIERVVSQACLRRIEKDTLSRQPEVFRFLQLQLTIAEQTETDVREQIRELSRRYFQREPRPEELNLWLRLADKQRFGSLPARDLAHGLCLAMGTQLEFLFF